MRLLSFIFAVITTLNLLGINRTDSVNVYFSVGHRNFDPSLANNRAVMDDFISKVKAAATTGDIESIVVYGYASPEGKPRANERLASNRCITIADYIAANAGVSPELIEKRPEGIAWGELRRLVATEPNVPYREQILDILDNTPVWVYDNQGRLVDSRKRQLMNLAGGRAWNWMYAHLFPELRNAVAISLYCSTAAEPQTTETTAADDSQGALGDSTAIETAEATEPAELVEVIDASETLTTNDLNGEAVGQDYLTANALADYVPNHRFALKTNMLYYAILMPNLELEWHINDLWSVALEGNVAWWGSYEKEKSYRIAIIDAEARRWIKPRAPWHGLYVGVIAGGGWYDLENGYPGRYGEGLMAGISAGYMWPIGRNLSLEAELGVGYMYTRYKEYRTYEGHHVYMRTKELNYWGPIKVKFSIAWRFDDINKPKLVNPSSL